MGKRQADACCTLSPCIVYDVPLANDTPALPQGQRNERKAQRVARIGEMARPPDP